MKKYWIFVPVVIILIIGVILSISLHVDTFEVMTIPRSYSYVSTYSDQDEMDVYVYVSTKNSYLTKKEYVSNAFICSNKTGDILNVKLLDITDCENKKKIYNHNFYLFKFSFDISFNTTTEYELSIKDAVLTLDYNSKEVNLELGSFYYYKMPYYGDSTNHLTITSLKPILGYIEENRTVSGFRIGLRNNSSKKIRIVDVKLLDPNIYPSLREVKIVDDENGIETMSSILGYNYNLKSKEVETSDLDLEINKNDNINIVIPIKYIEDYPINSFGFIISYTEEGSEEVIKYYYDDFIFFNSIQETYEESKLKISTYDNN